MLYGDQIQFTINGRKPASNRFTRGYSTEPVQYVTYNEEKTARYLHRGLKEKYTIELNDWTASDVAFFDALETSTVKNICTFKPSLDADLTKLSYFEYYIDPFDKVLKIEITPVFLLNYLTLPNTESYTAITQVFGSTIVYSQPTLNGVMLPVKTLCKISVDYQTTEKISITGKIHREYFNKKSGKVCKKIIFSGSTYDVDNDLFNAIKTCQGVNETDFSINNFYFKGVPVIDFKPLLKNQWLMNFKFEVQYKYVPLSIGYFAHAITTPVIKQPGHIGFIGDQI